MTRLGWRWAAGALSIALLLCGCQRLVGERDRGDQLEVSEVEPAADHGLSSEEDPQAKRRATPQLAGVMPGDFPPDVPVFVPSSLVDYGDVEPGRRYVELQTDDEAFVVSKTLRLKLDESGWAPGEEEGVYVKDSRRVRIEVTGREGQPSRLRIEYPGS